MITVKRKRNWINKSFEIDLFSIEEIKRCQWEDLLKSLTHSIKLPANTFDQCPPYNQLQDQHMTASEKMMFSHHILQAENHL